MQQTDQLTVLAQDLKFPEGPIALDDGSVIVVGNRQRHPVTGGRWPG